MRLVQATVYALDIPFVTPVTHSAARRAACDSVVVRVIDDAGHVGFGEGAGRPYVTGETPAMMVRQIAGALWPAVAERELPEFADLPLTAVDAAIPDGSEGLAQGGEPAERVHQQRARAAPGAALVAEGGPASSRRSDSGPASSRGSDSASRAALELAILDCALRRRHRALAHHLPPRRPRVTYSGVIPIGSLEETRRHAHQLKLVGFRHVKLKVGTDEDVARVRAVREILGPGVSLRVDANAAWSLDQAISVITAIAPFDISAVEQPVARDAAERLAGLRQAVPVPLMADESLVTLADADALIAAGAVDYFNIRVSKCGGLGRSLEIARRAAAAGIGVQVGSQVGETAILAAAGRHLAAALEDVRFVEGSYGTLVLAEDVSADGIRFGYRGEAPVLRGPGLGIRVGEDRLRTYAKTVVELT